ncbi:MAG TPA: NrfD/PsrC family molybdoenzyme membrane anchor subunit [Solirubrobacteraceae bacterium]|nr:NrfD/PsrC family molybdoenzyme membrane anchor subunit [Solirubrobacteraceae bacterium]
MNEQDVTRDGPQQQTTGRDARMWSGVGGHPRRDRAEQHPGTSYYGNSVINPPVWEEREIAGYLFLGGLAGASSMLAAGAEITGRPALASRAKLCASGAIGLSLVALIKDLGRPARFINMLRVFKVTSPMSVGTWIVSAYSPFNFATTASELTGILPALGTAAGLGAGLLGAGVASYTGALIADTAVPAWHEGYREMPFLFVGSASGAGGGFGLLAAPLAENAPAQKMAVGGAIVELVAEHLLERRLGMIAEALHDGKSGQRLRAAKALTAAGALGAATLGRRNRLAAAASGAALIAGSALTRFGIFAGGMASAKDPKYTIIPQRQRLEREGPIKLSTGSAG